MRTLELKDKTKSVFFLAMVVGILCFAVALFTDQARAWHAYVMNFYFVTSIALGGVFFAATQHLTSAGWSSTVRRIPEAFIAWLPAGVILILPIVLAGKGIYEWTHAEEVAKDHLLQMKSAYLNVPFFIVRVALFFAVWHFLGGKLVKNSLKQDEVGGIELSQKNAKLSAAFMPLFALTFTFFSVDLIMSLDPHWFSTMFGVNCFANLFLSALAVIIIIVIRMKRAGYFGESVNENHIQNLGLLMFAFVVFYAYIAFCQFMLIWYANMPEETSYYIRRWEGGWSKVAMTIVFVKFILPFLLLLPRERKRNPNSLIVMAYWVLLACWIDVFWMVMPAYSKTPFIPWIEFGMFLGFFGGFALLVFRFLGRVPVQPQKDPRVHEALSLHQ